jgi:ubiquinone biosynthesis protein COQ9
MNRIFQIPKRRFSTRDPKLQLLSNSMLYVPEFGFTKASLVKGANSLGWTDAAHGMCERGPIELVEYFITTSKDALSTFSTPEYEQ